MVPNRIQMGWCDLPLLFCAASETSRDVIDTLLQEIKVSEHPFEDKMLAEILITIDTD